MKQGKRLGICMQPVTQLWERPEALEASDELLCGWIYEGLKEKNGFLRVRTHYGYEGWMDAKDFRPIPERYEDRKRLYMVSTHMADVLALSLIHIYPEIAGSPRNSFRASLVLVRWR